jgi:hypothetical protein
MELKEEDKCVIRTTKFLSEYFQQTACVFCRRSGSLVFPTLPDAQAFKLHHSLQHSLTLALAFAQNNAPANCGNPDTGTMFPSTTPFQAQRTA